MPSETKRGAVRIVANYARLGTTVLLGLILVPVLIHGIGSDGYGLYALVGASVGFAQMFKDISRASMNRELGSSFHSGDPAAFRRTYAAACVVALGLATLSLLAFAALLLVVPLLEIPVGLHGAARWAITAAGATTFVTVALSPQSNMYMVTERFASYNVRQTLERVVYTGVAIVLFLVLDVGDPASPGRGLVLFSVCSNLGSTLVTLAAVASILRLEPLLRPLGLRADRESIRRVLGTSGWNALTTTAMNLHLRVDVDEWQAWAARNGVRADVRSFVHYLPDALARPVPQDPVPFSTPRAWAALSRALDLAQAAGVLTRETRRALAFGRLSPEDAAVFCALAEETIQPMRPLEDYVAAPELLPKGEAARWFILDCIRRRVRDDRLGKVSRRAVNRFLRSLPREHQLNVLADLVERWGALGADASMLAILRSVARCAPTATSSAASSGGCAW